MPANRLACVILFWQPNYRNKQTFVVERIIYTEKNAYRKNFCESSELVAVRLKMQIDLGGHGHTTPITINGQLMRLQQNITYHLRSLKKVIERSTISPGRKKCNRQFRTSSSNRMRTLSKGYIQLIESVGSFPNAEIYVA